MAGLNYDDINDVSSPTGTGVPAGMQSTPMGLSLLHLYVKERNITGVKQERRLPSGGAYGIWRSIIMAWRRGYAVFTSSPRVLLFDYFLLEEAREVSKQAKWCCNFPFQRCTIIQVCSLGRKMKEGNERHSALSCSFFS